ncbi:MAG: hypothetical protein PHV77_02000 [Candidatus Omnitrophica bacterium]|jgi:uncharacterized cysteine cluster protein YcgN (CxxCxxCC family)|nr:hypothetical protein [Candidatus Omnitrophota bacterium]
MDTDNYAAYLELKEKEHESLCLRCGRCCGIPDDPCAHLEKIGESVYACNTYANRLGRRKTISGKEFTCVHIKELIKKDALPENCAYLERRQ